MQDCVKFAFASHHQYHRPRRGVETAWCRQNINYIKKMAQKLMEEVRKITINTGNILSLNDITKKSGQNTSEELVEAISITLKDFQNGGNTQRLEEPVFITRKHDDLKSKLEEYEFTNLKIGLKIFLSSDEQDYLMEALDKAFAALNIDSVHNVVIAYNQKQQIEGQKDNLEKIKNIWKTLEAYAKSKKVLQIGIADVEETIFRSIYEWSEIKPSIIQINLATCCVVPPTLQAFCKENDVQLLTHSDPSDILPDSSIESVFGVSFTLNWAVRFLVHIKCRGVLATKGYLVSICKKEK